MNINKMIDMLFRKIAINNKVFYMERKTYTNNKTYKNYYVKINNTKKEFTSKYDLLLWLKEWK